MVWLLLLKELKKESSLVAAPDINKKVDKEKLIKLLDGIENKQDRDKNILKAFNQGYSQYILAKTIGISQLAVNGIIRRSS